METVEVFSFSTEIARHRVAENYHYTVVYLPDRFVGALPFDRHPRLRVEVELAGRVFEGAWQPAGLKKYLMVPKAILKEADLSVGDHVTVEFKVGDQDHVDLPEEIITMLLEDREFSDAWSALTPGKQRGLCYFVASAKRENTRNKRLDFVREAAIKRDGRMR